MSELRPTERFTSRVQDYARYRPTYPSDLIDSMVHRCGLTSSSIGADVGAGTGIFSRLLAPRVATVFAVEPNVAMSAEIGNDLANIKVIRGTAEATSLPDDAVDLITSAQAFHWFHPQSTRIEFGRILRPGGWVALVWNDRLSESTAFQRNYEQILQRFCPEYGPSNHRNIESGTIREFLGNQFIQNSFEWEQPVDLDAMQGRALSSSYAPLRCSYEADALIEELTRLFARHEENGNVSFGYRTTLFISQWV